MPTTDEMRGALQDGLDLTIDGWKKFNARDAEATEAAVEIMEAAAALAAKDPAAFFRIKPTERDAFRRDLLSAIATEIQQSPEMIPAGDLTGSQGGWKDFGWSTLEKLAEKLIDSWFGDDEDEEGNGGGGKPEEPEQDGFDFIIEEKFFWLDLLRQRLNQ